MVPEIPEISGVKSLISLPNTCKERKLHYKEFLSKDQKHHLLLGLQGLGSSGHVEQSLPLNSSLGLCRAGLWGEQKLLRCVPKSLLILAPKFSTVKTKLSVLSLCLRNWRCPAKKNLQLLESLGLCQHQQTCPHFLRTCHSFILGEFQTWALLSSFHPSPV